MYTWQDFLNKVLPNPLKNVCLFAALSTIGFNSSSVQRYFFPDNLISCCRYSESQTDFAGFNRKRISRKYEAVYCLCEDLIAYPNIIEYEVVKELFLNKASELETAGERETAGEEKLPVNEKLPVSESHKKNLKQKLSTKFPEIYIYQSNKVSMYPNSLAMDKVFLDFVELKTELESLKGSRDDNEKNVTNTAPFIIKDKEMLSHRCRGRRKRTI